MNLYQFGGKIPQVRSHTFNTISKALLKSFVCLHNTQKIPVPIQNIEQLTAVK